ncbi:MAG: TatD family hydrolase [Candidatus Thorarchaeota archaeon]|nr:TatD family hydrolase [Candidatus Thorarchaeota archaeon]
MELIDAHTHLDLGHFQSDIDTVIARAKSAGVVGIVNCSTGPKSIHNTRLLMQAHPNYIFHSSGCSVSQLTREDALRIADLTRQYASEVVAVGEVGLDYHWIKDPAQRKAQEPLFIQFMDLAMELHKPLVIHSRKAEAEAIALVDQHYEGDVLMHCYDGTPEATAALKDRGWSVTLPANFDKYRNRIHAAQILPLESIMLETDGPYLSPTTGRNEPSNVRHGCLSLARLLGLPVEDVAAATTSNAKRFYSL